MTKRGASVQLLCLWLALSSCRTAQVVSTSSAARPSDSGSQAPATKAPASSSSGSRSVSLPETPPGIDPARFEVLRAICSVASWNGPNGLQVGCRSNPPFDAPDQLPDGEIQNVANFSDLCALNDFYRGSFSSPGKEEVVLGLAPCGEARSNDVTPGNVLLVVREAAAWRVTAVEPSTNVTRCSPSTRGDRTLLVCSDQIGAYGDGSLWWDFTLDFSQPSGKRIRVFSKLFKSGGVSCARGAGFLVEQGLTDFEMLDRRFADADGDGDEDLSLTLERSYAPGSTALANKLQALCRGKQYADHLLDTRVFLPKRARFVLQFQGEPSTLVPTPETQELLEKWGKTAPKTWWNSK